MCAEIARSLGALFTDDVSITSSGCKEGGLCRGQDRLELSENLTIAPLQHFACCKKAKFERY